MKLTITTLLLLAGTLGLQAQPAAIKANRIILRVTDLKISVAFYKDRVGLPLQSTFDEFAVFGGDGVTVMLQEVARKSANAATTEGMRDLYVADFRDPDEHILSISGWVRR